ncbi:MAG TPA: DinB family protein [Ktedonobacterales bacterium]|nr:DinB family protein [Ktedonobacterales bacterium]
MDYQYDQAVEILRRTPATLTALLRGLPEAWTKSTAGPDTWSAYDVVGHLLHGEETDWIGRTCVILDYGEERPFDAFNRTAMFEKYRGYSLDQVLEAFEQARERNLATLSELRITPEKLTLKGTHPALGSVTLSQLLATWVVHDLNHVGQIVEVMSRQYAEAVGPWSAYLAILTRPILTE